MLRHAWHAWPSLLALRHSSSPTRALIKAILAHTRGSLAQPESPDYRFVKRHSADRDRHLRVDWLNVRSLAIKIAHRASRGISATAELLVTPIKRRHRPISDSKDHLLLVLE